MVIMAGMLPGVECARRRRLRQGVGAEAAGGTRRSSFCLYAAGHGGAGLGAGGGNSGKVGESQSFWLVNHNHLLVNHNSGKS